MKLTKANLQKIIQEEIENLISEEKFPGLKAHVRDLADYYDEASMESVSDTLPRWLDTDEPLNSLKEKYPGLKKLKGLALKMALGIGCLDRRGKRIKCEDLKS